MRIGMIAMFRDEAPALPEWLAHHAHRGIDEFLLINDRSADAWHDAVAPWGSRVSVVDMGNDDDKPGRQIRRYIKELAWMTGFDWVLLADLDEFVWCLECLDFRDFLADKGQFSAVKIPMLDFGDNGHETQPPSLVDNFTRRRRFNRFRSMASDSKWFFRPADIRHISHATCVLRKGSGAIFDAGFELGIRANHYKMQSRERWFTKVCPRGSADNAEHRHRRHSPSFFLCQRARCNALEDRGLIEQNERYGTTYTSSDGATNQLEAP